MFRAFLCVFLSGAFVVALATDAEARRGRWRTPVFVPTGGYSSTPKLPKQVVKVRDWPDTAKFRSRSGAYIDLGWLYKKGSRTEGQWVGYIGSSRRYVRLSQRTAEKLNARAGFRQLPDPPTRSSGSSSGGFTGGSSGYIWALVGLLIFFGGWRYIRTVVLGGTAAAKAVGRAVGSRERNRADTSKDTWARANDLIATKSMGRGVEMAPDAEPSAAPPLVKKPRPRIGGQSRPARKPNFARPATAAGMRASPGFGRRDG